MFCQHTVIYLFTNEIAFSTLTYVSYYPLLVVQFKQNSKLINLRTRHLKIKYKQTVPETGLYYL